VWPLACGRLSDGTPVISSCDGENLHLCVWDATSGSLLWRYEGDTFKENGATYMAFPYSQKGNRVAVSTDDGIVVLDGSTGVVEQEIRTRLSGGMIWDVSTGTLSDGSSFIVGAGHNGVLYWWDAETGLPLREPSREHRSPVRAVEVIGEPGRQIVVSGDEAGRLYHWDANTGDMIGQSIHLSGIVLIRANSGDVFRSLFAYAESSGVVSVWNARTGELFGRPVSIGEHIALGLALFESTGEVHVLVASEDAVVRHWNVSRGEYVGEFASGVSIASCTLDSGETVVAVGDSDGSIFVQNILGS
jgi:WD40 repeat protein